MGVLIIIVEIYTIHFCVIQFKAYFTWGGRGFVYIGVGAFTVGHTPFQRISGGVIALVGIVYLGISVMLETKLPTPIFSAEESPQLGTTEQKDGDKDKKPAPPTAKPPPKEEKKDKGLFGGLL